LSTIGGHRAHDTAGELTGSQRDWLRVRQHLREHHYDLAVAAADLYPEAGRVAGTPLPSSVGWIPREPVLLVPSRSSTAPTRHLPRSPATSPSRLTACRCAPTAPGTPRTPASSPS